jgi:hypothetical protein
MRIAWFALIVLASLVPNVALAQKAADKVSAIRYETCSCRFGYGSVCVPVVSCDSGGGHCSGTCSPPAYQTLTNR